jgi:hypothetical protein
MAATKKAYKWIRRNTKLAARKAGVDTKDMKALVAFRREAVRRLKEYVRKPRKKCVDMPSGQS